MTSENLEYHSAMGRGAALARQAQPKSKREQAADKFNEARKLAREALEEENREAEAKRVEAEYGPRLK